MVNSRSKGARNERAVVQYISDMCGIDAERNHSQVAKGGHDLLGVPFYAIEVKAYARYTDADRIKWWEQAVRQAKIAELEPAVWFRANRQDWQVMIAHPTALNDKIYELDDFRIVQTMHAELWCSLLSERVAANGT